MSRLEMPAPSRAQVIIEGLYKDLERRIEASPPGLCPVEMTRAFLELCHAQTCGKCVPCRIGLRRLRNLLTKVMDGNATMGTLRIIEETAYAIMVSADCAIGYEAARLAYEGIQGFRDDFEEHVNHKRCLCNYNNPVPCVALCPAEVDIPGYIALVHAGKYADAVRLIRKDNPFPTTCGFICEHPCEARCRRNIVDDAVNIRGLKRYAADKAGKVPPPACAPSTGRTVAIIGGGPAGLSAAFHLQLMGHQTTVYEMLPKLGGMLRYGIPNYRLPKDRLDDDINAILETGVEVKHNVKVGEDITLEELRQKYDAVLVTIGASTDKKLGLENEEAPGVISAVDFLRNVGLGNIPDLSGQEVAIVGGGNVSMDAVRTAVRAGAKKVSIVYRRRVKDMTALTDEIEGAIAEGVEIQALKAPARLELDDAGALSGLWVTPQMVSYIKDGRTGIKATGEEDIFIPCTTLVVAIGQDIDSGHFEKNGLSTRKGQIVADKSGGFADMPGVFSAGDCVTGPATVIKAIAGAKVVAANIDEYFGFHHVIPCDVTIPEAVPKDSIPCGRVNIAERDAADRKCDFDGVELSMSDMEACQESGRCLRCDHYGFGLLRGGRKEIW